MALPAIAAPACATLIAGRHRFRIAAADNAAAAQLRGAVGDAGHLLAVGDQQHGAAPLLEVADELDDLPDRQQVDACGGLIKDHQARRQGKHRRQFDALALAAAERLVHLAVHVIRRRQADPLQAILHVCLVAAQAQVVAHQQALEARWLLPRQRNAQARPLEQRQSVDAVAVETNLALVEAVTLAAHDQVGQGALARAVGADQSMNLARRQTQVNAVEQRPRRQAENQAGDFEQSHAMPSNPADSQP